MLRENKRQSSSQLHFDQNAEHFNQNDCAKSKQINENLAEVQKGTVLKIMQFRIWRFQEQTLLSKTKGVINNKIYSRQNKCYRAVLPIKFSRIEAYKEIEA